MPPGIATSAQRTSEVIRSATISAIHKSVVIERKPKLTNEANLPHKERISFAYKRRLEMTRSMGLGTDAWRGDSVRIWVVMVERSLRSPRKSIETTQLQASLPPN
eukprot:2338893-Amphidinium_carterae.1